MEAFYPSEIARLVLGYLKDEKCLKSWQTFLEESSNLEEYFHLYKKGKVYSTNVNGHSLLNILNEYCVLKSEVLNSGDNKTECLGKTYHISESEFLDTIKKDVFVETTKNAVDLVFQKYLPSSVLNERNSSLPDSSQEVSPSEASDVSSKIEENKNSHNTYLNKKLDAKEFSGKQNKVTAVTNKIKDKIFNSNKNKICIQEIQGSVNSKSVCELNIPKTNEALERLKVSKDNGLHSSSLANDIQLKNSVDTSGFISRQINNSDEIIIDLAADDECDKDIHTANGKSAVINENLTTTSSECVGKVDDTSLTVQADDDVELEIVKEIRKDNFISRMQLNQNSNCQSDLTASSNHSQNNNHVINIDANNCNKFSVHQGEAHSVQSTVTQFNNSKQRVNSSENNSVINMQTNNKAVEISQTVVCNVQSTVNRSHNLESNVKSSSDQANCNSPFLDQSAVVGKMPLDSTSFIFPNYSSNGSFSNNNAQFYLVLNTPVASNVSGTFLTLPGFQTNAPTPLLPAVGTCVENTESTTVSKESTLISSNVSKLGTTAETLNADKKSKVLPRVLKRISYAEFTDVDTEPDESKSPKPCKRRKTQQKGSPKKNNNKKDLTDQPGQKASVSQKHDAAANGLQNIQNGSKIKKSNKRKSKKKKSNKKESSKTSNNVLYKQHESEKTKYGAIYNKFINHFEGYGTKEHFLCPLDPAAKSVGEITSKQVTDHENPVSSLFNRHNNLQSNSSKTGSENKNHSALLKEDRVLKVVLSDVFSDVCQEPDASCNQCIDSSDLVRQNEISDNHTSNSEKLTVQRRKSPRIHKEDTLNSCELKSIDTINLKQKLKATKRPISSPVINKRKLSRTNGKQESNKNPSSFDMTTAVLNSMEEARQLITHSKKHPLCLDTKGFELKNSFKTLPGKAIAPKLAFQKEIHDVLTGKIIGKEGKDNNLSTTQDSALLSSLDLEKNLKKSSTDDSRENDKITVLGKNITSVLVNSECEKCNNLSTIPLEQKDTGQTNETEKIVSLKICKKGSSDTNKAEKHSTVSECIEKKRLLTNSLDSLHHVNVNTKLKTSVARKLKFRKNRMHHSSKLQINNSIKNSMFSAKNNAADKEDFTNCSSTVIFKAESDSFKSVNIINDNPDFIHQTSETSTFSVLTSISTNTKILDLGGKQNETKPHSDTLGASSVKGNKTLNVILPSTANHPIESQKCVLLPALLTNNLLTTCEKMDKVITETCTVEEKNTSTVVLSSSISGESSCSQKKCNLISTENPL